MQINKDTKIRYEITNIETKEKSYITLTMEQVEGSVPNFYKQVQKACGLKSEVTEITKREIIE